MGIRGSIVSRYAAGWSSPRDLSKRASLNAFAAGLDYAARIIVELILNPLLVRGLGSYLYGAWRILWRWTGYVWATSGRSAQALQWAIANRQHSTDYDEKRRIVGGAVVVWFMFLPILLIAGAVGVWLVPHLLNTPAHHVWALRMAAILLVADAVAVTLLAIPRSVLQGENLGYKRVGLSTLLILAQGGITAAALALDTGIQGIAVAHLIGTILTGFLFWRVAKAYVPWFGVARAPRETRRWLFGLSWWFTGWKFVTQLMTGGDILVLGIFASVNLVTVYSLTKFIPEALVSLMAILLQGAGPGLGGIIGAGDHRKAVSVRNETLAFTWLVSTVAGASVMLWNESFVRLWVGGRFYSGATSMLLIVIMVLQFVHIRYDGQVIDATLNVRTKVLLGLFSALFSLGLAAVLVGPLDAGIVGLCAGIITGRLILTIAFPWLVGKAIGAPLAAQLRGAIRPMLAMAALFAAAVTLGRVVAVRSWLTLVPAAAVTAVVLVPVVAVAGLSPAQRAQLARRVRQMVGATPEAR
jgi:O-antigen/teichoic acid export membrane protein